MYTYYSDRTVYADYRDITVYTDYRDRTVYTDYRDRTVYIVCIYTALLAQAGWNSARWLLKYLKYKYN